MKLFIKLPSFHRSNTNLNCTPVTENDPLGALTPDTSPVNSKTLHKSATLPSVERTPASTSGKPDDDILGSPFSSDLSRSSATLPAESPSLSTSLSSSIKSLTKSGVSSKLSSLRKGGSSYLQSYLSPNPATSKKTQEALTHGLTRFENFF